MKKTSLLNRPTLLIGITAMAFIVLNLAVFLLAPPPIQHTLYWIGNLLIAAVGAAAALVQLFRPDAVRPSPSEGEGSVSPAHGEREDGGISQTAGDHAIQIGIARDVEIGHGDKHVHGDEVHGDKHVHGDEVHGDKVAGDKIVYEHPPIPPVSPLHQLPPPPPDFTGRDAELDRLRAAVQEGGAVISGLRGAGGIGKTALALQLADELISRYPDAQLYLNLQGTSPQPLSPADALAHVVRAYHPTADLPESETELASLYHSVLHDQRALLLMDNAADADQVRPLVPPSGCLLLVTSRRRFTLPGMAAQDLDTLKPEDAVALLLRIVARIGDDCATEIARLCGYLPLALRLAGSAIAEHIDLDPADYARRLQDAHTRLDLVDASISLSYDLLDPDGQRRWCALSVFPGTFDRMGAAAVWGRDLDSEDAHDVLSQLVAVSLVEWDPSASRYHLHDLLRLFADSRLDQRDRAQADHRHAAHYAEVARAAKQLYLQGGDAILRGLALFDLEWPSIQAGQAWAAAHADADDDAARLCNAYPDAALYCLNLRLHSTDWIEWLQAALSAARRLEDKSAQGTHLGNLGNAYSDLGQVERAIEYHQEALKISREIGDRRGEGSDLGNLGNAYSDLGQVERAIEYYEQALAIAREIGDRRGEGNHVGNLGTAYCHLGQMERAIEYYEQALAIAREIGDRRGEGIHLNNLGAAHRRLGNAQQARACLEEALAIFEDIKSPYAEQARAQLAALDADATPTTEPDPDSDAP